MSGQTWLTEFTSGPSQPNQIVKPIYGSVFIQDYATSNTFSSYSPFDATTGNLSTTITTTDGFVDLGYADEGGVEFTPTYNVANVNAWQTRQPLRADVTEDMEQAMFTLVQSNPVVDCLYQGIQLSSAGVMGATGYSVTHPVVPQVVYRSLLFIGVDGSTSNPYYVAKLYPRCMMIKPDKQDWNAKVENQFKMTFQAFPDSVAGYSWRTFREGSAWRALGLPSGVGTVTATPASGAVSLSWTAATVGTGAPALTNYTVTAVQVSNSTAASGSPFTVASGTTTKNVTGLTSGQPYTFTVKANNSNGSGPTSTVVATPS